MCAYPRIANHNSNQQSQSPLTKPELINPSIPAHGSHSSSLKSHDRRPSFPFLRPRCRKIEYPSIATATLSRHHPQPATLSLSVAIGVCPCVCDACELLGMFGGMREAKNVCGIFGEIDMWALLLYFCTLHVDVSIS